MEILAEEEPPFVDLTTEDGVFAFITALMNQLRFSFHDQNAFPPGIVCLATRGYGGIRLEQPTPFPYFDFLERDPSVAARIFRRMARVCAAVAVVFFTEGRNGLYVTLEHGSLGRLTWRAPVTRTATGQLLAGEFLADSSEEFESLLPASHEGPLMRSDSSQVSRHVAEQKVSS